MRILFPTFLITFFIVSFGKSDSQSFIQDDIKTDTLATISSTADFEKIKGSVIIVHAYNIKTCPDWHEGSGDKAWIFTDEVVVN